MKTGKLYLLIAPLVFFTVLLLNTALYGQLPEQVIEQQQDVEQQKQHREEKFKLQGHPLKLIKKKISAEKVDAFLQEVNNRKLSQTELSDLLLRFDIKDEGREELLQDMDEYLKFVDKVRKLAPTALEVNRLETKIQDRKEQFKEPHSNEGKIEITKNIEKLITQAEKEKLDIKLLSKEMNVTQTELFPDILKQLGYGAEESRVITLQIVTQIDLTKKIKTLNSMVESMKKNLKKIDQLEESKNQQQSDEKKRYLNEEINLLGKRTETLYDDFIILVTGVDRKKFSLKKENHTNWNKEIQEIFSPLIVQLKHVTERPRQVEMLRSQIGYYEALLPQIKRAVQQIDILKKNVTKKATAEEILVLEKNWKQNEKEYLSKLNTARHQLFQLEKNKMSVLQTIDYLFESVFKQRGINMLYAVASFIITFFIFYLFRLVIRKFNPLNRSPKFMFLGNLIDVLLYLISFIMATTVMIIVLYVYGNWLVLGMISLVLLGIIWAAKSTLPKFVEQIKLLIGFGSVRQGERITVDGIPYEVISVGIYSYFENPLLQSATLRFPLKDLVNMRSHPCDRSEPWFPCKEGDYLLMDGPQPVWRKVVLQTPSVIKFEWFGMFETIQTAAFLQQNIFNLSEGPFWVQFELELGYNHRRDVDDICQKLRKITSTELEETPFAELMLAPWIDFDDFGNSSLVFRYWVQMRKQAAKSYPAIQRTLKKIALKAANKYDFEIIRFQHNSINLFMESKQITETLRKALPDKLNNGQDI
ncbi:hypothetical protein VU04_01280 [Desulfobulbus sp. TB]|nr:hypothetical protein [Desulfobulbus sp. TB]